MTEIPDDRYHYEKAIALKPEAWAITNNIKVSEYKPIASAYIDSVQRIRAFHWLPINLIFHMQLLATAHVCAVVHAGRDPEDLDCPLTEEDHAYSQAVFNRFKTRISSGTGGLDLQIFMNGSLILKELLASDFIESRKGGASIGIEAILAAMITACYSALETLASDLWIAAVNRHPDLAKNYLKAFPKKQIEYGELTGRGFDLSHIMGTVLTETKKVQFQAFKDVKEAYEYAFGDAVSKAFHDCDAVLHAEKVRHLIAHRGGIVDKKFKDEMADRPEYASLNVGDQIPFSGPIVATHFRACFNKAANILQAVDEWSSTAPTV